MEKKTLRMIGRILALIIVIVMVFFISMEIYESQPRQRVARFKEMIALIDETGSHVSYDTLKKFDRFNQQTERGKRFDAPFLQEYIQLYSLQELLKDVQKYASFTKWNCYESSFSARFVTDNLSNAGILAPVTPSIDRKNDNSVGYYHDHADLLGTEEQETMPGTFYDQNGENVSKSTRTNTSTLRGYGDYAIGEYDRYSYSAGEFYWENGVLHDRLPSWDHRHSFTLYYKGIAIASGKTMDDLYEECGRVRFLMETDEGLWLLEEDGDLSWKEFKKGE